MIEYTFWQSVKFVGIYSTKRGSVALKTNRGICQRSNTSNSSKERNKYMLLEVKPCISWTTKSIFMIKHVPDIKERKKEQKLKWAKSDHWLVRLFAYCSTRNIMTVILLTVHHLLLHWYPSLGRSCKQRRRGLCSSWCEHRRGGSRWGTWSIRSWVDQRRVCRSSKWLGSTTHRLWEWGEERGGDGRLVEHTCVCEWEEGEHSERKENTVRFVHVPAEMRTRWYHTIVKQK